MRVSAFHSTRGAGNRFQLNFRNHRKIVVVDGLVGWTGGINVGDEYLGRDPAFPNWRDTHVRIEGPAALALQVPFAEDWRWARRPRRHPRETGWYMRLAVSRPDSKLVYYSAWAFVGELLRSGVRIYRYQPGFSHQKVFLVDDRIAGVGTANLDNRSFRLNFEVTALVHEPEFLAAVERSFESDFARSREMTLREVESKGFWFRLAARAAYLTAPIQ